MVQAIINLGEYQDRVVTILKGKFGFSNKSEAINFVIKKYEEEHLEPELKPEYVEKLKKLNKNGKFETFTSIDDLRKKIENA